MMGRKLPYKTLEEWKEYGIERGYDERNPASLSTSDIKEERSWYGKGAYEKWHKFFRFKKLRVRMPWKIFAEWQQYGIEHRYNERNPMSLAKSNVKKERSWFQAGFRKNWGTKFPYKKKRIMKKLPYQTLEEWKEFGIEHGYNKINPRSLDKSKNKEERSWYKKGGHKKWIKNFPFNRKIKISKLTWKTLEEWEKFGIGKKYEQRSPTSLVGSKDKNERVWYNKGQREGWIRSFKFIRKYIDTNHVYPSLEEWKEYGIERGYDGRNPDSIIKSEKKEERSWYAKGVREGWLKEFKFKRVVERWATFKEWRDFGIEKGYDGRNPTSFAKSENKEERKWYRSGTYKEWFPHFPFARLYQNHRNNPQQLESLLESYVAGRSL